MDLGKQQIKHTDTDVRKTVQLSYVEPNCVTSTFEFIISSFCFVLIRQSKQELSGEETKWPRFRRTELGRF